jgi:hypothetical protein
MLHEAPREFHELCSTDHNSHSIGNSDRNQTRACCQKLVPGSVSCRTHFPSRHSIQYNSPVSDRRSS